MVHHISLSSELFSAERASEWFLIRVNPNVNFEVRSLWELFIASLIGATVGLGPIVEMIVGFQAAFSREIFVTARVGAVEPLGISYIEGGRKSMGKGQSSIGFKVPSNLLFIICFRDI